MSILNEILAHKRNELREARSRRPLSALESQARDRGASRGLERALRRGDDEPVRLLAEVKRASPSAGPIRADADPAEIASAYEEGGAAAVSVLTDERFFDGKLEFLAKVRERVALPLLRKDFLIDPYQVVEAAAAGADGILLIVSALAGEQLAELMAAAGEYDLDALVEAHHEREAEVALDLGTTLLGVNHRNLATFEIDMSLTGRIARLAPAGTVLVGESGIKGADDVETLKAAGAHAVLVGETLMRAESPRQAVESLLEGA